MKKLFCIVLVLFSTIMFLVGCGNESKIKELENNILELEEKNEDNQLYIRACSH